MLSTNYRLKITDICCRIKLNRAVTLEERIWMNKLIDHNVHARELAGSFICPDKIEKD